MLSSSLKSESFKGQSLDSSSFTTSFDHAAAGHDGLRCHLSGSLIAKPCTPGEIAFYESSAHHANFKAFMPEWYGTLTSADQHQSLSIIPGMPNQARTVVSSLATPSTADGRSDSHNQTTPQEGTWTPSEGRKLDTGIAIVLENIAEGFKRPTVLDVKLGSRLWADDAPPAKRAKLDAVSKETTSSSLGFRIAGMKVWVGYNKDQSEAENIEAEFTDPYMTKYEASEAPNGQVVEKNGYKRYDKWYGRAFTADNVHEGFETFLTGAKAGKIDRSALIASRILEELQALKYALESEESRMYSSSILVIYEGDPDALEEALKYEENRKAMTGSNSPANFSDGIESFDIENETEISEYGTLQPLSIPCEEDGEKAQAIPGPLNVQLDPASLVNIDGDGDSSDEDEEISIKVHDFRIIDFAHAAWTPGQGPDENALMGIRNLIKIMKKLAGKEDDTTSTT